MSWIFYNIEYFFIERRVIDSVNCEASFFYWRINFAEQLCDVRGAMENIDNLFTALEILLLVGYKEG